MLFRMQRKDTECFMVFLRLMFKLQQCFLCSVIHPGDGCTLQSGGSWRKWLVPGNPILKPAPVPSWEPITGHYQAGPSWLCFHCLLTLPPANKTGMLERKPKHRMEKRNPLSPLVGTALSFKTETAITVDLGAVRYQCHIC